MPKTCLINTMDCSLIDEFLVFTDEFIVHYDYIDKAPTLSRDAIAKHQCTLKMHAEMVVFSVDVCTYHLCMIWSLQCGCLAMYVPIISA